MTGSHTPRGLSHRLWRADTQAVYVSLHGHIRMAEVPRLRELTQALLERPSRQCYLDLSDVPYIDSTGLGMLTALRRETRERDCELALVAPSPTVLTVLRLAKLDQIFNIVADEEADSLRAQLLGDQQPGKTQDLS